MAPNALFEIFGKGIYAYGIFIAVGIILCLVCFYYFTKKRGMSTDVQDYVFFVAIGAIALGFLAAKLFQAFYDFIATGKFDFANAGITFMGGLIGGILAFLGIYFGFGNLVFKGKKKGLHVKQFNRLLTVAPICVTVAHAFGRIGCLMAGCCHGAYLGQDYVFGGMWMTASDTLVTGYYVPAQLYEALFLFVLTAVLIVLYLKRCDYTHAIYLIAYAIWRFLIEFARTDVRGMGEGAALSPSQWQSIAFLIGGAIIIVIYAVLRRPFFIPKEKENEKASDSDSNDQNTPAQDELVNDEQN